MTSVSTPRPCKSPPRIQGYSKAPGGCCTDTFINIHHTLDSTNLSAQSLLSLDTQQTSIRAAPRSSAASVRSVDHSYYLIKRLTNSPLQNSSGLCNHTTWCEVSVGELGQSCTMVQQYNHHCTAVTLHELFPIKPQGTTFFFCISCDRIDYVPSGVAANAQVSMLNLLAP